MIECNKDSCKARYIGETQRTFSERIYDHINYIKQNKIEKPTGDHFNKKGHNLSNMRAFIIEKVKKLDTHYRKEREHYHINKFNTYYKGLNKIP